MLKSLTKLFGCVLSLLWIFSGLYNLTFCQPLYKAIPIGPPGMEVYPYSVNEAGQVCGTYWVGDYQHAFFWDDGIFTDLGICLAFTESFALGINDSGQIAGKCGYSTSLWENGTCTPIVVNSVGRGIIMEGR